MKKQSKKFVLAGVVLLAITGLLALTSCKNDSVPEQGTSVQEETWLQEQQKELEGKTEGTHTITAPSYLTEGGLVKIRKLLDGAKVPVDLDLSQATGLTYIAAGAFIECFTLKSVELPSSVTEIGNYAFSGCGSLTKVTIPEGVTLIGVSAFGYTDLTEVTIPASVATIGTTAFGKCSSLAKVTILKGVTTIGYHAFDGCSSLTSVTIPASVTTIEAYAFSRCTNLSGVTIPDSVTTIGYHAFDGCSSLTSVTFEHKDGWHLQEPEANEIGDLIDVGTPSTNATKLKDDAGQWSNKYLIRK